MFDWDHVERWVAFWKIGDRLDRLARASETAPVEDLSG
jgi:hypothetical protein